MKIADFWRQLQVYQESGIDCVVVTVIGARGSTPADPGAKLLAGGGTALGTVGGGKVESRALALAAAILADEAHPPCVTVCWNLQRDVGMTCGGEMTLLFEVHRARAPWRIFIFGAGHVVQALVPVLLPLACRIAVFDTRADWLERLPRATNLEVFRVSSAEEGVPRVTAEGFALSITQGHATDFPVLRDLLRREVPPAFTGVIGSLSKRAVLARELREAGVAEERIASLVCPLGLPLGGNEPAEIAISVAAQILQVRRPR